MLYPCGNCEFAGILTSLCRGFDGTSDVRRLGRLGLVRESFLVRKLLLETRLASDQLARHAITTYYKPSSSFTIGALYMIDVKPWKI